jgi:uncharacterized protein YbjT (DUF2867 family)
LVRLGFIEIILILQSKMTILITCGTAKTSRAIVTVLQHSQPVLLASRSGKPVDRSPGVHFDWDAPDQWPDIFAHNLAKKSPISAVWLVVRSSTVDVAQSAIPFIHLLRQNNVKRIVLMSGSAFNETDHFLGEVHAELMRVHDKEGLEWAVLRPSWFMGELHSLENSKPFIRGSQTNVAVNLLSHIAWRSPLNKKAYTFN